MICRKALKGLGLIAAMQCCLFVSRIVALFKAWSGPEECAADDMDEEEYKEFEEYLVRQGANEVQVDLNLCILYVADSDLHAPCPQSVRDPHCCFLACMLEMVAQPPMDHYHDQYHIGLTAGSGY
jgi:hypothetical protein